MPRPPAATKPVLILQHLRSDDPAYLGTWLDERAVAYEVRNAGAGEQFPASIEGYAALAILGGSMSANDPLPSLRRAEELIRQAVQADIPVIGHCLGGQLMARALGAEVGASPAPEIGWQPMALEDTLLARHWLGDAARVAVVMQWHYEAFALPAGAQRLASSPACPNQAFALGPHLALQFHLEIDLPKLRRWVGEDEPGWKAVLGVHASVQSAEAMVRDAALWMGAHHALADRIYGRWLEATPWGGFTSQKGNGAS